ncbi:MULTISPECIES: DNA repair protein RecO [unclassified Thermosynechococcus]|uniref:DNA repair protein RecO n=1 Tax=unclassified Thermosynechococcus TaxID=2622553 RepID=UPI00197CE0F7|nr:MULTISPECIES: DNA repair protein RecO [unclassified Thermosynechococcus]QSF48416.1 DNA repair protein RecO [Thermosynechococcus sp. TA-1]WNC21452.1 DNA repair protein RecO [Thermosynechococcus sp. PP22]WNC31692.1 DNA repair protein RecO [Thermosynechococcus sp. PKX95]WNC34216.1 DNA repair protein RecO [Thermosynechococcus sp. PKX91]WNC36739.1 DNA repair protein RecO [Thermosynechococcus sp. WL11]
MGRTYRTIGINLKAMPLGESDRLLSVFSRDRGLLKLVAPHSRGCRSKLGGRVDLFVVNDLFISPGRNLDRILQAETVATYQGLNSHLTTLTAAQYLGEVVLYQVHPQQPQPDLFDWLCTTLDQLQGVSSRAALALLVRGLWGILRLGGIAPEWYQCHESGCKIAVPAADTDWRVGFSFASGGVFILTEEGNDRGSSGGDRQLTASEVRLGQWLALPTTPSLARDEFLAQAETYPLSVWLSLERILRQYLQFHLEQTLQVPPLLDHCFSPVAVSQP